MPFPLVLRCTAFSKKFGKTEKERELTACEDGGQASQDDGMLSHSLGRYMDMLAFDGSADGV